MPRTQFHDSPERVIHVQFPREARRPSEIDTYKYQTFVIMPAICALPYGLEREWGFKLQNSKQLAVFIPMRPDTDVTSPGIAVGGIFPCLTPPMELEIVDGYAIALIDFDKEIDLADREGNITLFAERTDGTTWVREPSLIRILTYAGVALATGIQIAKGVRKGYGEIRTILAELPAPPTL